VRGSGGDGKCPWEIFKQDVTKKDQRGGDRMGVVLTCRTNETVSHNGGKKNPKELKRKKFRIP